MVKYTYSWAWLSNSNPSWILVDTFLIHSLSTMSYFFSACKACEWVFSPLLSVFCTLFSSSTTLDCERTDHYWVTMYSSSLKYYTMYSRTFWFKGIPLLHPLWRHLAKENTFVASSSRECSTAMHCEVVNTCNVCFSSSACCSFFIVSSSWATRVPRFSSLAESLLNTSLSSWFSLSCTHSPRYTSCSRLWT